MNPPNPAPNYRKLRLRNITSPEFNHLLLLFGWVGYFILYFLTENLIPREACFRIHIFLDDLIPFCEVFVVPYVFWYFLIVWSLVYFAIYDVASFRKLMVFLIVTQITAMAIYILFPNRQDLRPKVFPRENIFTSVIGWLYALDTDTNVCPSLHVAFSIGIASVWLKRKRSRAATKIFIVLCAVLICLSTVFIKQHSALDGIAAIPVCLLAEFICYPIPQKRKK